MINDWLVIMNDNLYVIMLDNEEQLGKFRSSGRGSIIGQW